MPRRSHDSGFIRLNKLLAGKGVASRRHVEEMIIAGRIRVDGELATEKGLKVRPNAQIEVDGHVVGQPPPLAWVALHKPRGYVCTKEDSRDRPIVMDLLPPELSHLHPVGRLDGDVSGLLLFTNEGELTHRLTHPRYGIEKVYHCHTTSPMRPRQAQALEEGIELEDGPSYPAQCRVLRPSGSGSLVELRIHEGRKHQVKRMFEAVGNPLIQLERVAVGPVELGSLGRGRYRPLTPYEVIELHKRTMLPIPKGLGERSGVQAAPASEGEGDSKSPTSRRPRGGTRAARPAPAERAPDGGIESPEKPATPSRKPRPPRRRAEPQRLSKPSADRPERRAKHAPQDQAPAGERSGKRGAGRPRGTRPPGDDRLPGLRGRQGPSAWGVQEGIGPTRQPPERPPAWGGAEKPAGRPPAKRRPAPGGRPPAQRQRQGPPAWGETGDPGRGGRGADRAGTRGSKPGNDRPRKQRGDTPPGRSAEEGRPRHRRRSDGTQGDRRRPPRAE